jgi:putative membrane protein
MIEMVIRVILSIILLIVIIVILSKFARRNKENDPADSLTLMKKRFEEGEITEEEYEEAKRRRGK